MIQSANTCVEFCEEFRAFLTSLVRRCGRTLTLRSSTHEGFATEEIPSIQIEGETWRRLWDRFTDIKDIKKEMLKRLEVHFDKWLNP